MKIAQPSFAHYLIRIRLTFYISRARILQKAGNFSILLILRAPRARKNMAASTEKLSPQSLHNCKREERQALHVNTLKYSCTVIMLILMFSAHGFKAVLSLSVIWKA